MFKIFLSSWVIIGEWQENMIFGLFAFWLSKGPSLLLWAHWLVYVLCFTLIWPFPDCTALNFLTWDSRPVHNLYKYQSPEKFLAKPNNHWASQLSAVTDWTVNFANLSHPGRKTLWFSKVISYLTGVLMLSVDMHLYIFRVK